MARDTTVQGWPVAVVVGILTLCTFPPLLLTMAINRKPPANKLPASKRSKVKRMYERGVAVSAIADSCAVSRRTVSDWAKAGSWQRPGGNQGDQGDHDGGDQVIRTAITPESIDVDLILAETIMDLRAAMTAVQKTHDYRPLSNLAMAVFKALDTWEKRHPATPAALAMLAIEMGMKPRVFMEAVVEAWRLNSNGDNCELED